MSAVVFDCDGVIVDSEPISYRAWTDVLATYGYAATPDDFEAVTGTRRSDTHAYFATRADIPLSEVVIAEVEEIVWRLYETDLAVFDDAVEAIRSLAGNGIRMAVASSSSRRNLDAKLAKFDLAGYFGVIVSGDEVLHGKPAPDLYLAAAAGLGVDAASCLAVEDSLNGARSAAAAGMRVVTVARNGPGPPGFTAVTSLDADALLSWL